MISAKNYCSRVDFTVFSKALGASRLPVVDMAQDEKASSEEVSGMGTPC